LGVTRSAAEEALLSSNTEHFDESMEWHQPLIVESTRWNKGVEREMDVAESRFRALVEESPDAIALLSREAKIEYVSKAAGRMLGFSPEELVGQNGFALVHPDDRERTKSAFAELVANPSKNLLIEYRNVHKDGSWRFMEANGVNRLGDPGVRAIIGHFRDISERKAREETLSRTEQKYRRIFENAVEGIFQINREGFFIAANPALAKMLGYDSPEELTISAAGATGKVDAGSARRAEFTDRLVQDGGAVGYECELVRQDGRRIQVSVNARAVRDETGEIHCYEGTVEDVTDRRLLEEQYRQAQKMEAIGKLAAGVAHDFNNLLTVIIGYSGMYVETLRPEDPLYEPLKQIHNAGEHASALTRQLLAFSRKQVLKPVVLDLNSILAGMEPMLRRLIGEHIALTSHPDSNLWLVEADRGQLEQVVMNIVINARDAMPQGGKLLLETKNVVLDEGYAQMHAHVPRGEYVLLAVTDTGSGMDPAVKARIFEPFFTTKGPTKGTGLGLATVYGIVKQSGGHVEVYSEVGQGTTIKIYLPRDRSGAISAADVPANQEGLGGTETILLVEDEDGVRSIAKAILQRQGYTVIEARNGDEALMVCNSYSKPIALLLTDVVMPHMGGRQLGEKVLQLRPKMKMLYMSGYTDDAIVLHGVLESGTPFVQKPFSAGGLARKVREVLDG